MCHQQRTTPRRRGLSEVAQGQKQKHMTETVEIHSMSAVAPLKVKAVGHTALVSGDIKSKTWRRSCCGAVG